MKSQNSATNQLWYALGDLAEWFARLGGTACYHGFRDEEIPIAILILLQSRFPSVAPPGALSHFLCPQFWDACAPVLVRVRERIESINVANEEDINCVIADFTGYVNAKLKKEEIKHWPEVLTVLKHV
jgi:hypothetical protein